MKREPVWRRYLRLCGLDLGSDVEDELQFHIRTRIDELIANGKSPTEARREALRQFGPVDPIRRECSALSHDRQRVRSRREYFAGWVGDIRFAVRMLWKARLSTAAAVVILALGIGANTAVFTLLDRLLLAPLPVPNPSELRLVECSGFVRYVDGVRGDTKCGYNAYLHLRDHNQAFSGLAAVGMLSPRERRGKETIDQPANATFVSGNFFGVLGTRPLIGRVLTPADDSAAAPPVAVASHRFWSRRYNLAADVFGRVVHLNDVPFTIVGVLPRGSTGLTKGYDPDLYIPQLTQTRVYPDDPLDSFSPTIFGRLRAAIPAAQARLNLQTALEAHLASAPPRPRGLPSMEVAGSRIELQDGSRGIAGTSGEKKRTLLLVGGIVALLLLMSCFNVACLLVARGAARRHEFSIRLALGAGKARILRQCLVESCLLALAGGVAGLLTAIWATRLLLIIFRWTQRPIDISPDWRVVAFGLGVALATGILFGLAPALQSVRGSAPLGRHRAPRFASGKALVVVEVALSLVLVAGALVFIRSFENLRAAPVGFSPEHVTAITLAPAEETNIGAPWREAGLVAETLRMKAGIESATVASLLTFDDGRIGVALSLPEYPDRPKRQPNLLQIDGEYFRTLRIRLIAGRNFTPRDAETAPKVAILSEGTARNLFGAQNPIGRRILVGFSKNPKPEDQAEVVGIVNDIKFTSVIRPAPDVVLVPFLQKQNTGAFSGTAKLQIRSSMQPADIASLVRETVREQHLPVTVQDATTLETAIGASMLNDRLRMQSSSVFAGVALLLITAGIYGLMAYSVARRTREIGIRTACGSRPGGIVRLVLGESLRLVLLGVLIGVPGAVAVMRAVGGMLFGLPPIDGISLATAALVLCLTGIAASVAPAWRAARLDPVRALRVE